MASLLHAMLVLVASAFGNSSAWADDLRPTVEQVRDLLSGGEVQNSGYQQLVKLGARALPAYEVILADPESKPIELAAVMGLVSQIPTAGQKFTDLAVELFTHPTPIVRREAIKLLGNIGSERDTPPVLAMLSDEGGEVRRAAAKTLVKIGGKRDLVAMGIWLKTGNYRDDIRYLNYVKDCRDELEKRLKEAEKPKEPKK